MQVGVMLDTDVGEAAGPDSGQREKGFFLTHNPHLLISPLDTRSSFGSRFPRCAAAPHGLALHGSDPIMVVMITQSLCENNEEQHFDGALRVRGGRYFTERRDKRKEVGHKRRARASFLYLHMHP